MVSRNLKAGNKLIANASFNIGHECITHDIDLHSDMAEANLIQEKWWKPWHIPSLRIHAERATKINWILESAIIISMNNALR